MMVNLLRIFVILKTIKQFGLEERIILSLRILFKFFFFYIPYHQKSKSKSYGVRLALAFESLGPVFIKFGQLLSIRSDLVGELISKDLMKLQDKCSFVEFEQIKKTIEESFNIPINEIFSHFDEEAIASASIAQVHFANLKDGQKVAVKVVKPGIKRKIKSDIAILKIFSWIFDLLNRSRGIEIKNLITQFEMLIYRELDMRMEAANASVMTRNLAMIEWVKVPKIYWKYLREKVLVLERVSGISINEIEKLEKFNLDKELLAHRGLELVLRQIFQHNFFHADLHPGNILIHKNGDFALVDFGLVGCLNQADKTYLADNYLAFFKHDYARVVSNHIESGWVPEDTNVLDFQAHLRMVIEPLSQKSLEDISMAKLLMTLFIVARKFNMKVPHELALVDKTLLQIESMGKRLNANLNVWKVMEPLIEDFVKEQRKSVHSIDDIKNKLNDSFKSALKIYPALDKFLISQTRPSQDKFNNQPNSNLVNYFLFGFLGVLLGVAMMSLFNLF